MHLVVAGTQDAVMMVGLGSEVPEEVMLTRFCLDTKIKRLVEFREDRRAINPIQKEVIVPELDPEVKREGIRYR